MAPILAQTAVSLSGMARSTRHVILTKNIYNIWGGKNFLLPATLLLYE